MDALATYIRNNFFITNEEMEVIAHYFKPVVLDKGNFFLHAGIDSHRMAFVQTGLMRIFVEMPDREVTQWIVTANYFTTDLSSFIFRTPARWNMQALTDCELMVIERDDYSRLSEEVPKWKDIDRLVIAHCFTMLEERIFSHLHMTAEERFHRLMLQQPDLFNQVPLQYLASMLGMTPETLSRLRKRHLN